jgi:hypothetical protein
MSSRWGLRRKSLTVIIILGGRLERRKELVDRFETSFEQNSIPDLIFIALIRRLSTMMRKDFRLNCSDFYLLDDLLGIRKCRICLSEEIYS